MMNLWMQFWTDDRGAVLSAELVTVGTVAVLGTTVGMGTLGKAINEELLDVAKALRSLDQSYTLPSYSGGGAWTAGSAYRQRPVAESLAALGVTSQVPETVEGSRATLEKHVPGDVTPAQPLVVPAPAVQADAITVTPAEKKLQPAKKQAK